MFCFKNNHDYKCDNSSINKKLTLRDLRFRYHIACFCSISKITKYTQKLIKNYSKLSYSTVLRLWATWRCFMNQPFKWFGSVAVTHLLTVIWYHLLVVLISHLQYFCYFLIRMSFIARYVYTYEELVFMTEATAVQQNDSDRTKTQIIKRGLNHLKPQYSTFYASKHDLFICNCRLKHSLSLRAALIAGKYIYSPSDAVSVLPLHCKINFVDTDFICLVTAQKSYYTNWLI